MPDLVIKVKRPKGEDGYKTFSVRIKESTVMQLDDIAKQAGRSRNELIGMFLEYALKHYTLDEYATN